MTKHVPPALFVMLVLCPCAVRGDGLEMGFLEDWPTKEADQETRQILEGYQDRVRLAFTYDAEHGTWTAMDKTAGEVVEGGSEPSVHPDECRWHVVWRGQCVGKVYTEVRLPEDHTYCRAAGIRDVVKTEELETDSVRSDASSGWPSLPVRHPYVVLSRPAPSAGSPVWTRVTPPAVVPLGLLPSLQSAIDAWRTEEGRWRELPGQIAVSADDFNVVDAYRSETENMLHGVELKRESPLFALAEDFDGLLSTRWLVTTSAGATKYLGNSMRLLDYGDFDGDGTTDFVFYMSRYNRDGYVLFWHEFEQSAGFIWQYH